MRHRDIILVSILLFVIVGGMFTYTYLARQELPATSLEAPPLAIPSASEQTKLRIDAKHFFNNGTHTIVGEIALPTPCDLLSYKADVATSLPEKVTFVFTTINNSDDCVKRVTTQRFMVSAQSSKAANLSATFNAVPVELNLIEALPGENPESFELYFKG